MLPLPPDPTDCIQLADWLELGALLAGDHNFSYGDLERVVRRAAIEELRTDEEIERKIAEVADELKRRLVAAEAAYPFQLDPSVISSKGRRRQFMPYLFCLCLSYFGDQKHGASQLFPRRLFEDLSSVAASNYLSGSAIRFGWPRKGMSKAFKDAVTSLCKDHIGEGLQFREQPTLKSKDSRLDVVAWRDSPDKLPGKLLLFGACASGNDWRDKLHELNPDSFFDKWMAERPISHLKAFFVPHRLERISWKNRSWDAGIIFDRCRIAFWVHVGTNKLDDPQYRQWTQTVLKDAGQ